MVNHNGCLTMMNKKTLPAFLAALACLIGLAACAGPTTDTSFPEQALATTPDGTFPNVDNLKMVEPGMTKQQVYQLVGPPHFHESVFRVRVWNYLFHFRTADETVTCEYQIQFDDHGRVNLTRWNDQHCERFAAAKIASGAGQSGTTEKVQ